MPQPGRDRPRNNRSGRNRLPTPNLDLSQRFGPYRLCHLIAVGGMAEVYLAESDAAAGTVRRLALKVMLPNFADDVTFVQMLVDEAKLAVRLGHPHIVQTFDLGRIGETYFIAMEYVDGVDFLDVLQAVTAAGHEPSIDAGIYVITRVLGALHYAHTKRDEDGEPLCVVHRDVSPQNILVSRGGDVKITDFGIAKAKSVSSRTSAGTIKGKLVYMAPEHARGDALDCRADVYSAGVVLYEALVGRSLYMEQNPLDLLAMVREAKIEPPSVLRPGLDRQLDDVVMRALARDPAERFQTAREFGLALQDYQRAHNPTYGVPELAALVGDVAGPQDAALAMSRDDFLVRRHSIIGIPVDASGVEEIESVGATKNLDELRLSAAHTGGAESVSASEQPGAFDESEGAARGSAREATMSSGDTPAQDVAAQLVLLQEEGDKVVDLSGELFVIGRGGDLRLADGRVSRRHASVCCDDGQWLLEDLHSSNGTCLNDVKIDRARPLKDRDNIRVGPFKMRFQLVESSAAIAATASPRGGGRTPHPTQNAAAGRSTASQPEITNTVSARSESVTLRSKAMAELGVDSTLSSPTVRSVTPPDVRTSQTVTVRVSERESLTVPLTGRLPLSYDVQVGDDEMAGPASAVVERADGYWLEPVPGRSPIMLNGEPARRPKLLKKGDAMRVGPYEIVFN